MHVDDALKFVEELLSQQGKQLNDVQRAVFRGAWQGKTYKEIPRSYGLRCRSDYLSQDVAPKLWKLLREVTGAKITKNNLQGPIEWAWEKRAIAPPTAPPPSVTVAPIAQVPLPSAAIQPDDGDNPYWNTPQTHEDWGTAPDVSLFYGRKQELTELTQWITIDGCRLIALCGVGGVGKTDLSVKLAQQVKDQFECVIWRSLQRFPPPSLNELLTDLGQFVTESPIPNYGLSHLLAYLKQHPCLIVLDGFEAVLRGKVHDASYLDGYRDYGEFLLQVGQTVHHSCILLTSREKPREVARMEGEPRPVRVWKVGGLGELGGREIFAAKGSFSGAEGDWGTLMRRYEGNPLALNAVATRVQEVFSGQINRFTALLGQESAVFGEIEDVLAQQFERLSDLERTIVRQLAIHQGPIEVDLLQTLVQSPSRNELQEGLQSLLRRSLIAADDARYTLQSLLVEYFIKQNFL